MNMNEMENRIMQNEYNGMEEKHCDNKKQQKI